MDGFNSVGGLSGNKGWGRKVKTLNADRQISGHKQIKGWWEEEWQSCCLYYLSSVTCKFPVRLWADLSAVRWVILLPWGLKTLTPHPPHLLTAATVHIQAASSGDFNSHTQVHSRKSFFCESFTFICSAFSVLSHTRSASLLYVKSISSKQK